MDQPFIVYGRTGCEDTVRAREFLDYRGVPYHYININEDPEGERFVILSNNGERMTPTIVMGPENNRIILTEPSNDQIAEALDQLGYEDPRPDLGGAVRF